MPVPSAPKEPSLLWSTMDQTRFYQQLTETCPTVEIVSPFYQCGLGGFLPFGFPGVCYYMSLYFANVMSRGNEKEFLESMQNKDFVSKMIRGQLKYFAQEANFEIKEAVFEHSIELESNRTYFDDLIETIHQEHQKDPQTFPPTMVNFYFSKTGWLVEQGFIEQDKAHCGLLSPAKNEVGQLDPNYLLYMDANIGLFKIPMQGNALEQFFQAYDQALLVNHNCTSISVETYTVPPQEENQLVEGTEEDPYHLIKQYLEENILRWQAEGDPEALKSATNPKFAAFCDLYNQFSTARSIEDWMQQIEQIAMQRRNSWDFSSPRSMREFLKLRKKIEEITTEWHWDGHCISAQNIINAYRNAGKISKADTFLQRHKETSPLPALNQTMILAYQINAPILAGAALDLSQATTSLDLETQEAIAAAACMLIEEIRRTGVTSEEKQQFFSTVCQTACQKLLDEGENTTAETIFCFAAAFIAALLAAVLTTTLIFACFWIAPTVILDLLFDTVLSAAVGAVAIATANTTAMYAVGSFTYEFFNHYQAKNQAAHLEHTQLTLLNEIQNLRLDVIDYQPF